jgi:colicin import membrane protein
VSKTLATDLIIQLPAIMTAETFTNDEEFEKLYSKVKDAVSKHVPDTSTKAGREAIASLAYKVARTKTALIGQGKALTEGWRDQTKKVNAACNVIEERLDTLKDQVREPLNKWEQAEADRVAKHVTNLEALIAMSKVGFGLPSAEYREMLTVVGQTQLGASWEEYAPQASVAREDAIDHLKRMLATAEKQEADAAELERLRADAAERDRIEAERLAAEHERKAEEDRKAAIAQAGEAARKQAEQDAADRVALAERQAKESEERAERAIADAKAKAEREAETERQRVAAEKAAEDAEQKRRDADKEHRKQINGKIVAELMECSGISERQAQKIVVHLVSGLVPNVTLKY